MNGLLLSNNLLDEDFRELLTVSVELLVTLATALVENKNLVALYEWAYNLCNNLCTLNSRCANFYFSFILNEENLLELNSCVCFNFLDVVNEDLLAFFNLELLTVNFYDYVHFINLLNGFDREAKPPRDSLS